MRGAAGAIHAGNLEGWSVCATLLLAWSESAPPPPCQSRMQHDLTTVLMPANPGRSTSCQPPRPDPPPSR
jgi:hypothetical protein